VCCVVFRPSHDRRLLAADSRADDGCRAAVPAVRCGGSSSDGKPSPDGSEASDHRLQLFAGRYLRIHVLGGECVSR